MCFGVEERSWTTISFLRVDDREWVKAQKERLVHDTVTDYMQYMEQVLQAFLWKQFLDEDKTIKIQYHTEACVYLYIFMNNNKTCFFQFINNNITLISIHKVSREMWNNSMW